MDVPRKQNEQIIGAEKMFNQGEKLVDIARALNLPEGTVRRWKSVHKWGTERSKQNNERSQRKRGAQPGNKNATGPPGNQNARKHGFFSKWLPEEVKQITDEMPESPLDILWANIELQQAAIIRAQQLMYVRDQQDMTKEVSMEGGDAIAYTVQQAWDKHGSFMSAQSRAMKTLESMIKQYDEMLHKNWDLATEEQKARIAQVKAQTSKLTGAGQEIEDLSDIEGKIYGNSEKKENN